jgi:hypothetical protein
MPKKHKTPLSLYHAQTDRFKQISGGIRGGMKSIGEEAAKDLDELTHSTTSTGDERRKLLARLGHPFGRGNSAAESTKFGKKRGRFGNKAGSKSKGSLPSLPIGEIGGHLRDGRFVEVKDTKVTVGFNSKAGASINVVMPDGTEKMVARGFWQRGERGEMGKRMKARRKAFYDRFIKPNWRKP